MDYYRILNVDKDAKPEEIKARYKELAVKYHPDKNPDKDTSREFRIISEAYKTLSDPHSRRHYDGMVSKGQHSKIYDAFTIRLPDSFSIFNKMFGSMLSSFDLPKMPEGSRYYSQSWSSSYDGNKLKRKIKVDKNGQKDSYYDEYNVKDGKKELIKKIGNEELLKKLKGGRRRMYGEPQLTYKKKSKDRIPTYFLKNK